MPPGHSSSYFAQNTLVRAATDIVPLLINATQIEDDSFSSSTDVGGGGVMMIDDSLLDEFGCVEINGTVECLNDESSLGQLPANACVCELAATQFTPEYATFNLILIVACLPTVAAFGVITNALALFVYTRSHMITSTINLYLAALAISDIFVDICGISSIAIDSARRFDPLLNEIHLAIIPYTLPLCYIAQMCSVYFTVLAAFDCYLTVCRQNLPPPVSSSPTTTSVIATNNNRRRRKAMCGVADRNIPAKLYMSIIVVASFLYNSVTFFDLHVVDCVDYSHPERGFNAKKEICPTDLRLDPTYSQIYKVYMYAVFMTFLPFSILLTLNFLIIWKIYRMSGEKKRVRHRVKTKERRTDSIGSGKSSSSSGDDGDDDDVDGEEPSGESTVMLVMVVALFLVCNSIALVVNIIETFGNYPMEDAEAANRLFFVIDIGNFLVVFNSSANFLIYYAFSKAFRAVLTRKRQKILGRLTTSFSSLNTQYYLACSSIKINEEFQQTAPNDDADHHHHHLQLRPRDHQQQQLKDEEEEEDRNPVKTPAESTEATTNANTRVLNEMVPSPPLVSNRRLTPPTIITTPAPQPREEASTPPPPPRFLNGKHVRNSKNIRGTYELLSAKAKRVSPTTNQQQTKRDGGEKRNGNQNSSSIYLALPVSPR